MKKQLLAWALVLALLLALVPGALADDPPLRYVALGDELSLSVGDCPGFPQRLAEAKGWELENLAQEGQTVKGLLQQLEKQETVIAAVSSADIITVTIGLNDLLDACREQFSAYMGLDQTPETMAALQEQGIAWLLDQGNTSSQLLEHLVSLCGALETSQAENALGFRLQQFNQQWGNVAKRLLELNPDARILVLAGYNPYTAFSDYDSSGIHVGQVMDFWTAQLLGMIRQEEHCGTDYLVVDCGQAQGCARIDLSRLLDSPTVEESQLWELMDLASVPSESGLQAMADGVLQALKLQELQQLWPQEPVDLPFWDIAPEDPLQEAVELAYGSGLMEGVSLTSFAPQSSLTRAMVVTILYRMEGTPAVTWTAPFADVQQGLWYSDAVQWAWDSGIAEGTEADQFSPDDPVTIQELAAFFYRYAQQNRIGGEVSDEMLAQAQVLVQLHTLDPWAVDCVAWALTGGMLDLSLVRPNEPATRGDTAQLLRAFLKTLSA